jgi:hypothetical protein
VASNRTGIPAAAIIFAALLVFAILIIMVTRVLWPDFYGAVTETTSTTTHYTSSRAGDRVREVETLVERQKVTFWHLVGAFAIPVGGGFLIAWGGFKFNQKQRERDEIIENKQAQDSAIQAYLDQMSDLLVNQHLRSLPNGSDIHKLAEARTLEVLLGLDSERKRRPLKLVYGLGLITDLRGANLTNVDLSDANLSGANLLPYDEQYPAKLSLHNLRDHALPSVDYLHSLAKHRSAELKRLRGLPSRQTHSLRNRLLGRKPITFTNLTDTKLANANLAGAILANADLRNIRGLRREQVERATGNSETLLPKVDDLGRPLTFPKTWSDGIEAQIKEFEALEERKTENMDSQIQKHHNE